MKIPHEQLVATAAPILQGLLASGHYTHDEGPNPAVRSYTQGERTHESYIDGEGRPRVCLNRIPVAVLHAVDLAIHLHAAADRSADTFE